MMAQKHLHELLVEDQEPFVLEDFVSDHRRQLKRPPRLVVTRNSNFSKSLLKSANACFFLSSRNDGPRNLQPPPSWLKLDTIRPQPKTVVAKDTIMISVPARTAALLLEAPLRIESCSSENFHQADRKSWGTSTAGVGRVESLLRRLKKFGKRLRKKEFYGGNGGDGETVLVRDILRWDSSSDGLKERKTNKKKKKKSVVVDRGESGYGSNCSCTCSESSNAPSGSERRDGGEFFDDSEGSVPRKSSFRCPTPELQSPVASPSCCKLKDKESYEEKDSNEIQAKEVEECPENEKERSSPVSVLDPPLFDVDDATHEHEHMEDHNDEDEYEYEYEDVERLDYNTSYAIVQRTKQQLLRKLYRFEKLAELDPIELEKRMLEQDTSEDEDSEEYIYPDGSEDNLEHLSRERSHGDFAGECMITSRVHDVRKMRITKAMMKLVSGLIVGEQQKQSDQGGSTKWWADMVVQGRSRHGRYQDHLEDAATEIELAILGFLVEELSQDLSYSPGL